MTETFADASRDAILLAGSTRFLAAAIGAVLLLISFFLLTVFSSPICGGKAEGAPAHMVTG